MTERRYGAFPPDEPVIGAPYPASPPPTSEPGSGYIGASGRATYDEPVVGGYEDDDEYDDEYADDDEYGYGYDDGYYHETPARQPIFYVFIALAALIGGLVIVLLYSIVKTDDGNPKAAAAGFNVRIDAPTANTRVPVGKVYEVQVSATSNEPLTRLELFVNDRSVDQVSITAEEQEGGFAAHGTLSHTFVQKGEFKLVVRVTSSSGATKDSESVKVIAVEDVGERPVSIKGKVVATVNVRKGPGDNFDVVKTLNPGEEVSIIGKTRDREWLLVDIEGGLWVKRTAIQELDSLDLVPVREPTPVPQPTATNTPPPQPSASPSPSPNANAPDLAPTNAALIDGGSALRVTVANLSVNAFSGSIVVSVSGVNPGTLTQAFGVSIAANGAVTVDFDLNPAVTTQKTAVVKVDPDNAIKEGNEDNNTASFGLTPPAEAPDLAIIAHSFNGNLVTVTIKNNGGPLPSSSVTVKVSVGSSAGEETQTIVLANGQTATFSNITKPTSGQGTIQVIVGGQVLASQGNVTVP